MREGWLSLPAPPTSLSWLLPSAGSQLSIRFVVHIKLLANNRYPDQKVGVPRTRKLTCFLDFRFNTSKVPVMLLPLPGNARVDCLCL